MPPLDPHDGYLGTNLRWVVLGTTYDFTSPIQSAFTNCQAPPGSGTITYSYNSTMSGDLFANSVFQQHVVAPAQTQVSVTFGSTISSTSFYNTEMLSLDIFGGTLPGGMRIRESPTLASIGSTTITDIGGGQFQIDSFFDVFTELSLDGGNTWNPSTGSTRMTLGTIPEPATAMILGGGLVVLAWKLRKRSR